MKYPGRKVLPRDVPSWIDPDASNYFVTICCETRAINQLCVPLTGEALLASARFYYEQAKWFPFLFLLMPDHLHMLVSFSGKYPINKVLEGWKRYNATIHGIAWQRGFFEHRLRGEESIEEKGSYIVNNPVRAGLVNDGETWPYSMRLG